MLLALLDLLGGVFGTIFPRSGLRTGDGDLGFLFGGDLGAGAANPIKDCFDDVAGTSCWLWSTTWLANWFKDSRSLAIWSSCSMALCSCGFQPTSSMVGVGLGGGDMVLGLWVTLVVSVVLDELHGELLLDSMAPTFG